MKKFIAIVLSVFVMLTALCMVSFAEDSYYLLSSSVTPEGQSGYWVTKQEETQGYFGVMIKSPSNFKGLQFSALCGANVPLIVELYESIGDVATSIEEEALFTKKITVDGNHITEDTLVTVDFGKTYAAGEYVIVMRYDGNFVAGGHAVFCTSEMDAEVEATISASGLVKNSNTKDGFAARLILSSDAPTTDDNPSQSEETPTAKPTTAPTKAPSTQKPNQNNTNTADDGSIVTAAVLLVMAVTAFVVIRKKYAAR